MKSRTFGIFGILAAVLSLSACSGGGGGGGDTSVSTNSQSLSYQFEFNGCNTGRHEFSSLEALCKGLQDDALNKYCAVDLRVEYFLANCFK